ncbi:MAG: type II toxin-antitoxin system death-on-curing family toxin [Candidatus Omnitrophota bacterium]
MRFLTLDEVLTAHEHLLRKYGGSPGIRDQGLLESAVHRPQAVVFGKDAYPTLFDKAAAICHSLLFNHPFIDGNKRVAFAACHLTLLLNGWNLTSSTEETYEFLIETIKNQWDWQEISAWLKKHSKKGVKGV